LFVPELSSIIVLVRFSKDWLTIPRNGTIILSLLTWLDVSLHSSTIAAGRVKQKS